MRPAELFAAMLDENHPGGRCVLPEHDLDVPVLVVEAHPASDPSIIQQRAEPRDLLRVGMQGIVAENRGAQPPHFAATELPPGERGIWTRFVGCRTDPPTIANAIKGVVSGNATEHRACPG